MNLNRFIGKCLSGLYIVQSKIYPSFSQAGEDQIMRFLFERIGIRKPTYLDLGTNHPYIGNNTYLFYVRGSKGVCVEPDSRLINVINRFRRKDVVLHAGVGVENKNEAEFFVFPHPYSGWNTFSEEEARKRQEETDIRFIRVEKIPLININDVMGKYFRPHPNLVSIDVEGMDLNILRSIDFLKYQPEVICTESVSFSMENKEVKIKEINDFMITKNYFLFGDTHINSIYCRRDIYKSST